MIFNIPIHKNPYKFSINIKQMNQLPNIGNKAHCVSRILVLALMYYSYVTIPFTLFLFHLAREMYCCYGYFDATFLSTISRRFDIMCVLKTIDQHLPQMRNY